MTASELLERDEPRGETLALALVTASVVGFVTAVTMLGPLLVDMAIDLDVSLSQAGLLAAATALPWALGAPLSGLLSDRLGRRPMIVLALGGVAAASLTSALAPNFATLLGARFLVGVFGAFGPPSLIAAVGDLFPPRRRGMAMGWLNMGFSLAAIGGVPVMGVIGGLFGWRWAFVVSTATLIALAILVHLAFPTPAAAPASVGVRETYQAVLKLPFLPNFLAATFLERTIFQTATLYLPSFLILSYGLNAVSVAPALVLVAVGAIGGNLLGGWLSDRFPKARVFIATELVAAAIGLLLFGVPLGLVGSSLVGALFGLANSAGRPPFLALGSEMSARHRGAVLGLFSSANQSGVVCGSALGGLVLGLGSYSHLGFVIAAAGVLAAALTVPLATLREPRKP